MGMFVYVMAASLLDTQTSRFLLTPSFSELPLLSLKNILHTASPELTGITRSDLEQYLESVFSVQRVSWDFTLAVEMTHVTNSTHYSETGVENI